MTHHLNGRHLRLILAVSFAWFLFVPLRISVAQQSPTALAGDSRAAKPWVADVSAATLPTGVTHHTYFSAAMQHDVGYCIYLPPGYSKETTRRYPVIYNLHGSGGNELRMLYNAQVLHEGIVEGRWPELIMVFPNGGRTSKYRDVANGRSLAETTIIKELLPHIDNTYRTVAARHGRCIEGFSMGGLGSTFLAMKHPDLFCSLFNQAGNVFPVAQMGSLEFADHWPVKLLGTDPETLKANDSTLLLAKNLDQIKGKLRIQIACGTRDTSHLSTIRNFHQALLAHGVDHTYIEIEGLGHSQKQMVGTFKLAWFDYHVESLRQATAAAGR